MRVQLTDRPDILGVLVDGKPVAGAVAYDLEAGYVEVEIPTVPKLEDQESGSFEIDADEEVLWTTQKLTGKIQLAIARKK